MLDTLFSNIPEHLRTINYISSIDAYKTNTQQTYWIKSTVGGFNTFSRIGGYKENAYPNDWNSYTGDGFTTVVVHENAHQFDHVVHADSTWEKRFNQIKMQCGTEDLNYLRSQVGAAYFNNSPQEIIASTGNQWFLNTYHTLGLALKRFDEGYKEPLHWFLFYADLLSNKGDTTFFYKNDQSGLNFEFSHPTITRDIQGRLTAFSYKDSLYSFTLNDSDNVVKYKITDESTDLINNENMTKTVNSSLFASVVGNGKITLNYSGKENAQVKIFDLSGRLLLELNFSKAGSKNVSLRGFRKGVYIISFKSVMGSEIRKVLYK